jgi:hypothetical protein
MTHAFRRFVFALLTSIGVALPASATNFSTDYTDLWFIPAESGWGINLSQQGNTIFGTLFVYGTDQTPRWYVASALVASSTTSFTGPLYRTTGPYFGNAWTGGGPAVQVGTMTLNFDTPTTATLTYSADGVNVTKRIERQTFVLNNLGGSFLGGLVATASACVGQSSPDILVFDHFNASHSGNQVSLPVTFFAGNGTPQTCTFTGTYGQSGKLGNVTGNWSCNPAPNTGTFTISQIDVAQTGWSGRFSGRDQFCTYNGFFGGTRDVR